MTRRFLTAGEVRAACQQRQERNRTRLAGSRGKRKAQPPVGWKE
ncbi:hypothetical protein E2C01_051796 [Portunus trituberculatus]|uniref:Uncharacterized protein n=1 Tax=Portunus trituberculatus TaxID=210409 RepID=A0A5B7GLF4_PORTR|nr:hypothetical protein [Portunus trituberculatus]